jgi:ubiquinone/menaquinone biosynthesis C-methylase UbiE
MQPAAKQAAIHQWSNDPCGPEVATSVGTREHAEALIRGRQAYAPWMAASIGYAEAQDTDVLDVGSGQGLDVIQYALAGARVTGVDLTPHHVELARTNVAAMGLEAEIVNDDAEHLPFPDASFDRVSSNGVLHHTPDIESALASIRRVLRPGGRATIIVYNRRSLHYWLWQVGWEGIVRRGLLRERSMAGVLSAGVERSSVDARPLVRVYSERQTAQLLRDAGFIDVRTHVRHFHAGDVPYGDALRKRLPSLVTQSRLDWLGRRWGWYVVAYGYRPHR